MKTEEAPSCLQPATGFDPRSQELCAGCDSRISERFLLRVDELSWHERCLKCSVCSRSLSGRCFSRDRRLYCPKDYQKLFQARCSGCRESIGPSELVLRALHNVYHVGCFCCRACERRLRRGDLFVLREGQLLCPAHCQDRELLGSALSPAHTEAAKSEDEEGSQSRGKGGGADGKDPKRSKRPRTILSSHQRRAFKASFEVSSKPCRKVRETLAAETGLTVRVVQVWFQNQRAKMKKIARRQQQQQQQQEQREQFGNAGLGSGRGTGRSNDDGEEAPSAPGLEGLPVPHSRLPELSPAQLFRPGMTPPRIPPEQPPPYGNDSEGVFQDLSGCLFSGADPNLLLTPGIPGNNPIDRLYSMHSSYFTS